MVETATETKVKNEVQTAEKQHVNLQTDFSLGIFGTSDNFKMAWQMAQALSQSTVVPKDFQGSPSNCLIAIEQANRLHMSPFMVMQNLYPIQGRPSWSSKFLIAMINGSGKFDQELQFEETRDKNGKPFSCLAWTTKNGRRIDGMTVDMDMAQAEGWLTKNGSKWKTMPQLMLRYRAASFFSSLNCPELTLGIYTQEEVEDNDFTVYQGDITARVQSEIAENANAVEFVPEPADEPGKKPQKQEKPKHEPEIPDFMSAE